MWHEDQIKLDFASWRSLLLRGTFVIYHIGRALRDVFLVGFLVYPINYLFRTQLGNTKFSHIDIITNSAAPVATC